MAWMICSSDFFANFLGDSQGQAPLIVSFSEFFL